MPISARKRASASENSPDGKSVAIWTALIGGIATVLVAAITISPNLLKQTQEGETPGPSAPEKVRLNSFVRCIEFPDNQGITRNEFRWLRDLCLGLDREAEREAQKTKAKHFPAIVFETNIISKNSTFKGRIQCGVYTAIDGYAFLADPKKKTFTPLSAYAYAESEANECAFRFETPIITNPQSILLVLSISGDSVYVTQDRLRRLALEVNP